MLRGFWKLTWLETKIFTKQKIWVFLAGDLHHYRRHAAADGAHNHAAGDHTVASGMK